jgi:hypothetical protein
VGVLQNIYCIPQEPPEPKSLRSFAAAIESERLLGAGAGLLSMRAIAARFRRQPAHFYDWPANLGLYLLPGGHDLCVGATDDDLFSDEASEAEPAPPVFSGKVYGCIWLHGKNAPLLEDFIDSDLHRAMLAIWPDATIVEDCWL